MAYSADSFVTNEQPSTAKWNKLWDNDASFNDGTGIGDNAIAARSLDENAIYLGHVKRTSQVNFTTETLITDLELAVTVPSGTGRRLEVGLFCPNIKNDNASTLVVHVVRIRDGAIPAGTQLQVNHTTAPAQYRYPNCQMTDPLLIGTDITDGAHTFRASAEQGAGTGNVFGTAGGTAFLYAKLV